MDVIGDALTILFNGIANVFNDTKDIAEWNGSGLTIDYCKIYLVFVIVVLFVYCCKKSIFIVLENNVLQLKATAFHRPIVWQLRGFKSFPLIIDRKFILFMRRPILIILF
jgi:hypothetical protein